MKLIATTNCKDFPEEVLDLVYEEFQFYCDEEFPMPWDAEISVDKGNIILAGGVAPGGRAGRAVVTLKPADFNKYVRVESTPNLQLSDEQVEAFMEAGWRLEE